MGHGAKGMGHYDAVLAKARCPLPASPSMAMNTMGNPLQSTLKQTPEIPNKPMAHNAFSVLDRALTVPGKAAIFHDYAESRSPPA